MNNLDADIDNAFLLSKKHTSKAKRRAHFESLNRPGKANAVNASRMMKAT